MILYDISMTIKPDMAVYKNRDEKKPKFTVSRDFNDGSAYETRLDFDLHTGTHIDMPLHMIPEGESSESWALENIFTACLVLDFTTLTGDCITAAALKAKEEEYPANALLIKPGSSVLLKTSNSLSDAFDSSFIFLEKSGAEYLADKEVAGIGIDALGIERDQPGHETHKILLNAGIWILEGLRLADVPGGYYTLAVAPLKIGGVEALPARALLLPPGE